MQDTALYEYLLGLKSPWKVGRVELNVSEVFDFAESSNYGQQASLFGRAPRVVGPLIDLFANQVCRVNLNAQRSSNFLNTDYIF